MKLNPASPRRSVHARSAFTLLEVALATFITVGLLLAVLFFFRQAERLRQELLDETEQITAARMIMDRISTDLRSLHIHDPLHVGLMGDTNHLEFVMATPPSRINWQQDDLGRVLRPRSDLRLVRYELAGPGDPSEATGLARSETAVPEFAPIGTDEEALEKAAAEVERELLTEQVRHLQFRFWNGTEWTGSWTSLKPPLGVEITLGGPPLPPPSLEPLELAQGENAYPFEPFRRVVSLTLLGTITAVPDEAESASTESGLDEDAATNADAGAASAGATATP